ncbi:MAG: hypothetical protein MMC23_001456 [Stictis urceolatum]|nr:hypothetical protein [Stictis urceolata]
MAPQNTTHLETTAHPVVVTAIAAPSVAAIFVVLLVYTRSFINKMLVLEDYTSIATFFSCVIFSVFIAISTRHSLGMHIADMSPAQLEDYWKWDLISSEFYLTSLIGYKLAILLRYNRIFGISRKFRYSCWMVEFFTVGYLVSNLLTQTFGCQPIRKFWAKDIPGHCANEDLAGNFYGAFNFVSDLMIAILPMPMIWNLKMNRKEKIGLFLIFLTGAIAFVVALTRWIYVLKLNPDRIYYGGISWLWAILEVNTGLICGCSLALKPLFRTAGQRLLHWTPMGRDDTELTPYSRRSVTSTAKRQAVMSRWLSGGRKSNPSDPSGTVESLDMPLNEEYAAQPKSETPAAKEV